MQTLFKATIVGILSFYFDNQIKGLTTQVDILSMKLSSFDDLAEEHELMKKNFLLLYANIFKNK